MANYGLRIGYPIYTYSVLAVQGGYALTGQNATLTYSQPIFFWDAPVAGSAVTGYRIYWGTSTGSYPNGPHEDTGTSLQEICSAIGLTAGVTYYMIVRAYNGAGESSNSNEIVVLNGVQIGP